MPRHRPGSANVAASVCSIGNKKDHYYVGRLFGGVWRRAWGLPYPASGGQLAIASPRRAPRLRVDTSATAPETRSLPAVLRAHTPTTSTDCPAASDGAHTHGMIGCNMTAVDQGDCCSSVECSSVVCSFCAIRGITRPITELTHQRCH